MNDGDLKVFTVSADELRGCFTARIADMNDRLAAWESLEVTKENERAFVVDNLRRDRERVEELAFLRDHVADGDHRLDGGELLALRGRAYIGEATKDALEAYRQQCECGPLRLKYMSPFDHPERNRLGL